MKTKCSCGQPVVKVWETISSPMPPGDIGSYVTHERIILGSCSNGCHVINIGKIPILDLFEQKSLWSVQEVKKELGLE